MRITAILAVVLVTACVSVGRSVLNTSFQTNPVERDNVFVYVDGDSIPDHTRVAMLDAKGNTDWTDEGDLLNKLREEAGKLGANAIIWGHPRYEGVRITRQSPKISRNVMLGGEDPRGSAYYWMHEEVPHEAADPGTDYAAVREGDISVTPLHFEHTAHEAVEALGAWDDLF